MIAISQSLEIPTRWSSPVARQAHNLEVVGSNPTCATSFAGAAPACRPEPMWNGTIAANPGACHVDHLRSHHIDVLESFDDLPICANAQPATIVGPSRSGGSPALNFQRPTSTAELAFLDRPATAKTLAQSASESEADGEVQDRCESTSPQFSSGESNKRKQWCAMARRVATRSNSSGGFWN